MWLTARGALSHITVNIHKHGVRADTQDAAAQSLCHIFVIITRSRRDLLHASTSPWPEIHATAGQGFLPSECTPGACRKSHRASGERSQGGFSRAPASRSAECCWSTRAKGLWKGKRGLHSLDVIAYR